MGENEPVGRCGLLAEIESESGSRARAHGAFCHDVDIGRGDGRSSRRLDCGTRAKNA
jgi:hypothetical protein